VQAVLPVVQLPPQVVPAFVHGALGACGWPELTGEQVPGKFGTSHAWQEPVHALLQQ
jgi:hypothetical protein